MTHDVKICNYSDKDNKLPSVHIPSALYDTGQSCPFCGCTATVRMGARRRKCKNCKHSFLANGVKRKRQFFPGVMHPADMIPSTRSK